MAPVIMSKIFTLPSSNPYKANFADNSWENIIMACQNNEVPDTWAIADSKTMTIGGENYQIDIIGKHHDTYSDGSGTAPITFQFHDCYGTLYSMEATATNANGWDGCMMRNTYLPAIKSLMPVEVQNAIRSVNKLASAGNKSTTIITSADELFLLSTVEFSGGTGLGGASGEGSMYEYYSNGNGVRPSQWTRSSNTTVNTSFNVINSNGSHYAFTLSDSEQYGVAPAFCF